MLTWLQRRWKRASLPSPKTGFRTRLTLDALESREVPAMLAGNGIALVTYNGSVDSTVSLGAASDVTLQHMRTFIPFDGYRGPLVATAADVNGDGIADAIVAAQKADGHVKVYDGVTGGELWNFFAFPGFGGTVNVGAGDVNGDGHADILISADAGDGHVMAYSGQDGSTLASFLAYPGFLGGVSVSGGDFNGDGRAEIIVGAGGKGVGGRVALFNADGSVYDPGFFAFPGFDGTISVAGGDVTGDGISDVVVGAGPGSAGGPVVAFSGVGFLPFFSITPYTASTTNGLDVQVADGNLDGRNDIFIILHGGGTPSVSVYDGPTGYSLNSGGGDGYNTAGTDYSPSGGYDYWSSGGDSGYTPPSYDPGSTYDPGSSYTPSTDTSGSYDSGGGSDDTRWLV